MKIKLFIVYKMCFVFLAFSGDGGRIMSLLDS